jgi:hypothetical protein
MGSLLQKVRTARRMPFHILGLAAVTVGITGLVRCALWLVPFRTICRSVEARGPHAVLRGRVTATQVAWMVRAASRGIPRATCLTQALTAQILLNWAGLENRICIGVAKGEDFEAHAWVECENRVVLGGAVQSARYAKILTLEGSA